MPFSRSAGVTLAIEGPTDEIALQRVLGYLDIPHSITYGRRGKDYILERLAGYNNASRRSPWLVVVDLDQEGCPVAYARRCLPVPAAGMCFRIAVHEVEAWLLGDRQRVARFFSVPVGGVPSDPEDLANPKQFLVDLCRRSRRPAMRLDMVPREGSGRQVGPAYTARLVEFLSHSTQRWRPEVAARHCPSLARAMSCLRSKFATEG